MESKGGERSKSKKKHKHDSSSSEDEVTGKGGMDNIDRLVEEIAPVVKNKSKNKKKCKGDENNDVDGEKKKVEDAPVEKNKKSKKKGKELNVDNEGDALIGSEVEHADKGNEGISVESGSVERKKSKKTRKDGSLIRQEDKMKDTELVGNAPSERKKLKKKHKDGSSSAQQDKHVGDEINTRSDDGVEHANKGKRKKATESDQAEGKKSKKKHNGASIQSPVVDDNNGGSDKEITHANKGKKKKSEVTDAEAAPKKSKKKERVSGKDEVFTLPPKSNVGSGAEDNLVRGKRFTKEEDEVLKQAVIHFIAKHDLGEEGLDMVLNSKKHEELRGCWREIASQIPYRPYTACYYRAQVIFRRSKTSKWTQEEYDMIMKHQAENRKKWKDIAEELGKHRWHVKDTWRRIHMQDVKKGIDISRANILMPEQNM